MSIFVGTGRARQSRCSHRDIVIAQAQVQSQPSGLPTFLVEITYTNTKVQVSNIHFYCEQFSSAIDIRPDVFKCIAVNDSLANGGKPLAPGLTLSFTYANSTLFQLTPLNVEAYVDILVSRCVRNWWQWIAIVIGFWHTRWQHCFITSLGCIVISPQVVVVYMLRLCHLVVFSQNQSGLRSKRKSWWLKLKYGGGIRPLCNLSPLLNTWTFGLKRKGG